MIGAMAVRTHDLIFTKYHCMVDIGLMILYLYAGLYKSLPPQPTPPRNRSN